LRISATENQYRITNVHGEKSIPFVVFGFKGSAEFLIIPEVPGEDVSLQVPAASQTSSPPAFGLRNIAKYDRIRSRRKNLQLLRPGSAFFQIMTSKILGVREIRYNRAHSRPRCTRSSPGFFDGENAPSDDNIQANLRGDHSVKTRYQQSRIRDSGEFRASGWGKKQLSPVISSGIIVFGGAKVAD